MHHPSQGGKNPPKQRMWSSTAYEVFKVLGVFWMYCAITRQATLMANIAWTGYEPGAEDKQLLGVLSPASINDFLIECTRKERKRFYRYLLKQYERALINGGAIDVAPSYKVIKVLSVQKAAAETL